MFNVQNHIRKKNNGIFAVCLLNNIKIQIAKYFELKQLFETVIYDRGIYDQHYTGDMRVAYTDLPVGVFGAILHS